MLALLMNLWPWEKCFLWSNPQCPPRPNGIISNSRGCCKVFKKQKFLLSNMGSFFSPGVLETGGSCSRMDHPAVISGNKHFLDQAANRRTVTYPKHCLISALLKHLGPYSPKTHWFGVRVKPVCLVLLHWHRQGRDQRRALWRTLPRGEHISNRETNIRKANQPAEKTLLLGPALSLSLIT